MPMVFELRSGAFLRAGLAPGTVGAELTRIKEEYGELTPEAVLEQAKKHNNSLHAQFDWDDTVAAGKWRREQAAELIRVILIRDDGVEDSRAVRAFVKLENVRSEPYRPVVDVLADPEMRARLLQKAHKELDAWTRRYANLEEFAGLIETIKNWRGKE